MQFTKTALTIPDQITLLKKRGLKIENEDIAEHHLYNISYYRLSAYLLSFQIPGDHNHKYKWWAPFNRVMRLYVYDRELRSILLDAIERIEVAFRCRIVYEYSLRYGNNWYESSSLFLPERFQKFKAIFDYELDKSKEVFISHYKKKYTNPKNPPAWMTIEILSFGQISKMFEDLINDDAKKAVASYFGISVKILESWIRHLVYIRNICAHHSRVWNRTLTIKAVMPNITAKRWITIQPSKPDKIYSTICIIGYLMKRITFTPFLGKIIALQHRFSEIEIRPSGFPENWLSDVFWKNMKVTVTYRARIIFYRCKHFLKSKLPVN